MPSNEAIPFYDDGDNITGYCEAAVVGKTFVMIGASRTSPTFNPTATTNPVDKGCVHVKPATAGAWVFGVAAYDAAQGSFVNIIRGSKMVVPVTASAALTAGQGVEAAAGGQAAVSASGVIAGHVVADAAVGVDAQVSLA